MAFSYKVPASSKDLCIGFIYFWNWFVDKNMGHNKHENNLTHLKHEFSPSVFASRDIKNRALDLLVFLPGRKILRVEYHVPIHRILLQTRVVRRVGASAPPGAGVVGFKGVVLVVAVAPALGVAEVTRAVSE